MTKIAALLSILLVCVLECSAQQKDSLSDGQALAAAGKAFTAGGWNPAIFEVMPIKRRMVTVEAMFPKSSEEELRKDLLANFGAGPCTVVSYQRRAESFKTNSGEDYCRISFLVFSALKVAVIDSRAYPCAADKLPQKLP